MSFDFVRVLTLAGLTLAASACRSTVLPAVIAEDSAPVDADAASAGDAADAGDAESCSALAAGRYALRSRSNGLCLGQGAATTVLGTRAFSTAFAADCRLPAQSWDLLGDDAGTGYVIRSVLSGYVLDVRTGDTADATPVITYPASGRDNQLFDVRARDAYGYELRPLHSIESCVTASANSAEIDACEPGHDEQEWLLQRTDCL